MRIGSGSELHKRPGVHVLMRCQRSDLIIMPTSHNYKHFGHAISSFSDTINWRRGASAIVNLGVKDETECTAKE